jgi:hypothetical protein
MEPAPATNLPDANLVHVRSRIWQSHAELDKPNEYEVKGRCARPVRVLVLASPLDAEPLEALVEARELPAGIE